MAERLVVTAQIIGGHAFTAHGRDAWALLELVKAGAKGCTPIDNPAPRWSGYVFNLKRRYGVNIETLHEAHRGNFPGTHGRYLLLSHIVIVNRSDRQELQAV